MSTIQRGYGSEWHMLRYLGRHRERFDAKVLAETGGSAIEWLDFGFTSSIDKAHNYGDAELEGLNFLSAKDPVRLAWKKWWPQTGKAQTWDAVGRHQRSGLSEWLLVEAKANIQELRSSTGAKGAGLRTIEDRLSDTQRQCGVVGSPNWTRPYYQYANRLAALHFLHSQGVPARLLFVYFIGDCRSGSIVCPTTKNDWKPALDAMKKHLGLTGKSPLEQHAHELFLPVC